MTDDGRRQVGVIDLTPKWKAVLPIYVEMIREHQYADPGTPRGKLYADAFAELLRMAELADLYVAEHD